MFFSNRGKLRCCGRGKNDIRHRLGAGLPPLPYPAAGSAAYAPGGSGACACPASARRVVRRARSGRATADKVHGPQCPLRREAPLRTAADLPRSGQSASAFPRHEAHRAAGRLVPHGQGRGVLPTGRTRRRPCRRVRRKRLVLLLLPSLPEDGLRAAENIFQLAHECPQGLYPRNGYLVCVSLCLRALAQHRRFRSPRRAREARRALGHPPDERSRPRSLRTRLDQGLLRVLPARRVVSIVRTRTGHAGVLPHRILFRSERRRGLRSVLGHSGLRHQAFDLLHQRNQRSDPPVLRVRARPAARGVF